MLLEYLQDYTDRVKPLQDQNELFGKIQTEFEKKWDNGTFPGWPVSFNGVWVEHEPWTWTNCFTFILSLCCRASCWFLGFVVGMRSLLCVCNMKRDLLGLSSGFLSTMSLRFLLTKFMIVTLNVLFSLLEHTWLFFLDSQWDNRSCPAFVGIWVLVIHVYKWMIGQIFINIILFLAERDKQCPDPCWSSSWPFCILFLGGTFAFTII